MDYSLRETSPFWQSPAGQASLAWEQQIFTTLCEGAFGYYALNFSLNGLDALRASTVQHPLHTGKDVVFDPLDWPFQNDTLDLIVLPHVLEFSADPHGVLREAARCLRPGGALTLTAFNPRSLLALRAQAAGLAPAHQWISRRRLIDWMRLLNLHSDRGAFGQWRPPSAQAQSFARWRWLDQSGEQWWPQMANIYALRAIKRISPDIRRFAPAKKSILSIAVGAPKPALHAEKEKTE